MKLKFDLQNVRTIEFGVGRDDEGGQIFCCIPVDNNVQKALQEMASCTWNAMQRLMNDNPSRYEPSEKYENQEYVYLPLSDSLVDRLRELHQATNLLIDLGALADVTQVFCYFARMTDKNNQCLTGLRRATQFKGVLKSRLVRFVTDALELVKDRIFKLDSDFDLLIDSENVHILRPSGFEFTSKLQEAILAVVPKNIEEIQKDLPFVDFVNIQEYASKHPRAARYLASIRTQKETQSIDLEALKELCKRTGVEIQESNSKLLIPEHHVMGFLEVLDRRRYEIELIMGSPERYRAASRRKVAEESSK